MYVYYITQDVQTVVDQLREAYEREEIKREAKIAEMASRPGPGEPILLR